MREAMLSTFTIKASVVALALGAAMAALSIGSAPAKALAPLPNSFFAAVGNADVTIVVATPSEASAATVPELAAVDTAERANGRGSGVVGASLVELTQPRYPHGHLVWAVGTGPTEEGMLLVELVDAKTGRWLEGDSGYYPAAAPGRPWAGSAVVRQSDLSAVSCVGALACVAIGDQDLSDHPAPVLPLVKPSNKPLSVMIGQTAAVIAGPEAPVLGSWDAISCTSLRNCIAVADGYAGFFDGRAWQATALPLPSDAPRASQLVLSSVSCPDPQDCMAVGRYIGPGGQSETL
ncbi:MAG TPA: hypothetical protein VMS00_10400, partial [Acidimicrobiales bacterium]|nr:hypothetical protein [Acidimicrobiales bacterium]